MSDIPASPADFTTAWLEQVLGAPAGSLAGFDSEAIGTGQIADSFRIQLRWDAPVTGLPDSLVAKCPSPDETSLASARLMNLYVKEVSWYQQLAGRSSVCAPACYFGALNDAGDQFVLLLEDCAPARQGDQLAGADLPALRAALEEAARLHAPFLNEPGFETLEWLRIDPEMAAMRKQFIAQFWPAFRERYQDRLATELFEMGDSFVSAVMARDDPEPQLLSVAHGDFRIDNMLFGRSDGRAVILDWQTLYPGHPLTDVSYLIGTSVAEPEQRRSVEEELVGFYCAQMESLGAPLDWQEAWTAYRLYASSGFVMAITASMLAQRTDRGDEMFAVMAERPAQQMIDLDTLALL
ncbi:MAG: phosphotransferase [Halieaceae bacterium]|nr:phosphotransferase [Halieaceae bacterium]